MAKRVLAVSGRKGIAPALQVQIELRGDSLEFTLAASGNEALWEIRGSPYDLVLSPSGTIHAKKRVNKLKERLAPNGN